MVVSLMLLALFFILSVSSMRITTVCARGLNGFDVDATNGKIGSILATTNFFLFLVCSVLSFIFIEWHIVLPLFLFSLISPGFLVTKNNLDFWVKNKVSCDVWLHLFGIGFLVSINFLK